MPVLSHTSESLERESTFLHVLQRYSRLNVISIRSGHEVPAYTHGNLARGQAALEMFRQVMAGEPLTSA